MKKYISILLILVGCSSPTNSDDESGYPIQIKQWTIESPTLARWTGGVAAKSLAVPDSVKRVITEPGDFDLTITDLGDRRFQIAWVDTFKWQFGMKASFKVPYHSKQPPIDQPTHLSITPIEVDGETVGTVFKYHFRHNCIGWPSGYPPLEQTMSDGDTVLVLYEIHADGYKEVMDHIACP